MNTKHFTAISVTLLVAMMLTVLPLPEWVVWWRPVWVFMVLLFWMMALPHRVGIVTAFVTGLFLDLLTGTLFGQHALVFTIIAYFMIRFQEPIHSLPPWQRTLLVLIATVGYLTLQYWIMAMASVSPATGKYWLAIISTTILWPWLQFLLKDFYQ